MHVQIRQSSQVGIYLGRLPGGRNYVRVRPMIYGPVLNWIELLRLTRESEVVSCTDCEVYRFENATSFFTVLLDRDGFIIQESLMNRDNENSFLHLTRTGDINVFNMEKEFPKNPEVIRNGTWVFLPMTWDVNYGHWLVEVLPRLSAMREVIDFAGANFLINHQGSAMRSVCIDTLGFYGVKEAQIFTLTGKREVYENLIFATPITKQPWVKAPLAIYSLENLANRVHPFEAGPQKIFIDRDNQSRRGLINRSEVAKFFQSKGYVLVDPGKLSFRDQVISFKGATHVVGVLGAECTNVVFSKRGVRFLGLAPESMQDDFFWDLVSHKAGSYFCLHGKTEEENGDMNSRFVVDLEMLEIVFLAFEPDYV